MIRTVLTDEQWVKMAVFPSLAQDSSDGWRWSVAACCGRPEIADQSELVIMLLFDSDKMGT